MPAEAGRYRIGVEGAADGIVVWVALADGDPLPPDAHVALVVEGVGLPLRLLAPGRFATARPAGDTLPLQVAVHGPAGLDRGAVPLP